MQIFKIVKINTNCKIYFKSKEKRVSLRTPLSLPAGETIFAGVHDIVLCE